MFIAEDGGKAFADANGNPFDVGIPFVAGTPFDGGDPPIVPPINVLLGNGPLGIVCLSG